MSVADINNAIRRWWLHDRPKIQTQLIQAYRVGSLPDGVLRLMHGAMRESFIAGWKARGRLQVSSGRQRSLLDQDDTA